MPPPPSSTPGSRGAADHGHAGIPVVDDLRTLEAVLAALKGTELPVTRAQAAPGTPLPDTVVHAMLTLCGGDGAYTVFTLGPQPETRPR